MFPAWRDAARLLADTLPGADETSDDRFAVHGTDQWKRALYRLNFALREDGHNSAVVELDPFQDLMRVIFFSQEVDDHPDLFEALARRTPHSTWGHWIDPESPVDYPRTDGHQPHPEVKFEFHSLEHWQDHKDDLGSILPLTRIDPKNVSKRIFGSHKARYVSHYAGGMGDRLRRNCNRVADAVVYCGGYADLIMARGALLRLAQAGGDLLRRIPGTLHGIILLFSAFRSSHKTRI